MSACDGPQRSVSMLRHQGLRPTQDLHLKLQDMGDTPLSASDSSHNNNTKEVGSFYIILLLQQWLPTYRVIWEL